MLISRQSQLSLAELSFMSFIISSCCVYSGINVSFLPYAQSVASVPAVQYVGSSQALSLAYWQLSSPEGVLLPPPSHVPQVCGQSSPIGVPSYL